VASYDASINVLIKGQSNLDRIVNRLNQFESQVQRINATPIDLSKTAGSGEAADRLGVVQRRIQQLRNDYLELGEAQERYANGVRTGKAVGSDATINQLKAQAELFESVARNSKLASAQFREMTIAASMAASKANEAGRERLAVLAEAFSSSGARSRMGNVRGDASLQLVQQLIAANPSIVRSEAALNSYRSELADLQALVPFVSKEFRALEEAIAGVDQELSGVGLRGQKSPKAAGPATEFGSIKEYQQRQKYADDLLATQRKLERISVNLDAAAIAQNDKAEIRNRLGEAFNAIERKNFSLAQNLGREADRYLRDANTRQINAQRLESQRLRVQTLNEKAAERTALYASKLESNIKDGISPLQAWQQRFDRIEQTAADILKLSKDLGDQFDEDLKKINYREGALKTRLGGGEEVAARQKDELRRKAAAKAVNTSIASAELSVAKLTASLADTSDLDSWVNGFKKVEDSAQEILDLSKKLGEKFDRDLRNIKSPEKPLATRLGGGQEVAARQKYLNELEASQKLGPATKLGTGEELIQRQKTDREIAASGQKRIDLNNVIARQFLALKTLSQDFLVLESKGVKFLDEKDRLTNLLANLEGGRLDTNEQNVKLIGEELKLIRAIASFRKSEARAAGTYQGSTPKTGGKSEVEAIEARRNKLLENALSLQSNLISIEGRGGQVAQEKLELEAKILYLKNLQNKASQADLQIIAQQIQELRIKGKTVSNEIPRDQKKLPFLERRFGKERAAGISEGLVGGAFPLLFGQGVGASLGGLAGGAAGGFLGGGLGFGLSLVGTTLGSALDQSVAAAKELGNALAISKDNFSDLRQQGVYFTAELENQVRLTKERGQFQQAQQLQRGAVFAQTGDIDTTALRGAAAASNELQKAWNGVKAAVGSTLAAIATPFIFALTGALRLVQGIVFLFNLIPTGIAKLASLIPGVEKIRQDLEESAIRGTEEYENQLAEINKQISAADKLNKISAQKNSAIQQSLGASKVEYEFATKRAEAQERVNKLEKEIQDFRASAPTGTAELRAKAATQEAQMRAKFAEEERSTLLGNAREVFDAVNESNKRIAELKKQYERDYRDTVRQNLREQQDMDLSATRKAQDARMQMQEQELNYTKQIAQERIKGIQLANQEQSLQRGIQAQLSANPTQSALVNEVQTAIEEWRTGRRAVEEEYAAKQQEIQFKAQKAEIAIQRYKFDNALRIARANEDSQLKINRLQDQINRQNDEVSKNEFQRKKDAITSQIKLLQMSASAEYYARADLLGSEAKSPGMFTPVQQGLMEAEMSAYNIQYQKYTQLLNDVEATFGKINTSKLPGIGPAPKLTDTSATSTALESQAVAENAQFEKELNTISRIQGLRQQDFELAKKILDPQADQLGQLNQILKAQQDAVKEKARYRELISSGVAPELAKELITIEQIRDTQLENLDILIKTLEAYKDPALANILEKLKGIREGAAGKAGEAISGAKAANAPGEKVKDFIAQATAELNDLEGLAIRVSQSIGDAVGNSLNEGIIGLVEGTTTAEQVFADFLRNIGQILIQEGAKIIATYIAIGIAKAFAGLASSSTTGPTGPNPGGIPSTGNVTAPSVNGFDVGSLANVAADGAYFSGGMSYFAKGGVVSSPTLFQFADGGTMQAGLMGEAGPEAIMPLERDGKGRLGVKASGVVEALAAARGALSGAKSTSAADAFSENKQTLDGIGSVERERNIERVISSGASSTEIKYSRVGSGDLPFVTEEDMLQATRIATQEGAKLGQQRTLAALKNNPGARRTIGI
jgi:hypothetical protein